MTDSNVLDNHLLEHLINGSDMFQGPIGLLKRGTHVYIFCKYEDSFSTSFAVRERYIHGRNRTTTEVIPQSPMRSQHFKNDTIVFYHSKKPPSYKKIPSTYRELDLREINSLKNGDNVLISLPSKINIHGSIEIMSNGGKNYFIVIMDTKLFTCNPIFFITPKDRVYKEITTEDVIKDSTVSSTTASTKRVLQDSFLKKHFLSFLKDAPSTQSAKLALPSPPVPPEISDYDKWKLQMKNGTKNAIEDHVREIEKSRDRELEVLDRSLNVEKQIKEPQYKRIRDIIETGTTNRTKRARFNEFNGGKPKSRRKRRNSKLIV